MSAFGWDYPAGVTDRDIEREYGDGEAVLCRICCEEIDYPEDDDICEACKESTHEEA